MALRSLNLTKNASFGRVHAIVEQDDKLLGVADPDWESTANDAVSSAD